MAVQLDIDQPEFWEEIYEHGRAGWDLGGPTPVFRRLLAAGDFRPGRMLVTCAGRGHDAREFARRGFQVDAVEFAQDPVRDMIAMADPGAPVRIFQTDLFALPHDLDGRYDYVLEYTCFCAIKPARRAEYADLIARVLRPGGILVALIFPTQEKSGGPPYYAPVSKVLELLQARGFTLVKREVPPDSVNQRAGQEELVILQKEAT